MGAQLGSSGARSGRRRRRPAMSEINVTPMVDVMLVLLIIFMVAAPLLTTGVEVDLPQGGDQVISGGDRALDVTVSADGTVFIGEDAVSQDTLIPRLRAMRAANPELRVVVSGDREAAYGDVIRVMVRLKDAGFAEAGLKTAPAERQ